MAKDKLKKTEKQKEQPKQIKTVDQLTFARIIAHKFNLKLSDVVGVIEEEQKLTMEYARLGYKVIKKNYLTIESKIYEGKDNWVCPLNGKTYTIQPKPRVMVRVGSGFKQYIANQKMPDRLCRFVDSQATNC